MLVFNFTSCSFFPIVQFFNSLLILFFFFKFLLYRFTTTSTLSSVFVAIEERMNQTKERNERTKEASWFNRASSSIWNRFSLVRVRRRRIRRKVEATTQNIRMNDDARKKDQHSHLCCRRPSYFSGLSLVFVIVTDEHKVLVLSSSDETHLK